MSFLSFLNPVHDYQRAFDFLRPAARAARSIGHLAADVPKLAIEDVRLAAARATGNEEARAASRKRGTQEANDLISAGQAIPRGLLQLKQSLQPGQSQTDITPDTPLSKAILGDQPISSIQKEFQQNRAAGQNTSEALGGATLSFLGDVALGKGSAGKIVKTAKGAIDTTKAIGANEFGAVGKDINLPENPRPGSPTDNTAAESVPSQSAPTPVSSSQNSTSQVSRKTLEEPSSVLPTKQTPPETKTSSSPISGSALDELKSQMKTTHEAQSEANAQAQAGLSAPQKAVGKITQKGRTINEAVFDRLAPFKRLQDQVEEATGSKLPIEARPYDLARLHAGLPEAIGQQVETLDKSLSGLKKSGIDVNDLNAYGAAQRILSDRKGISSFVSPETAQRAIDEIDQKYTPEQVQTLKDTHQTFVSHNSQILDAFHESGLIGKNAYKAIKENNQAYYSPFQLVDAVVSDLEKGGKAFGRSASFNVAKQNVIKSQAGMREGATIVNPLEATISNTERAMRLISSNNVGNALGGLSDAAPGIIQKVRSVEDVQARAALQAEAQHLRPLREQLGRYVKQQGKYLRQLDTELSGLNRQGLNRSLKTGGQEPMPDFLLEGLGGKVPTSKAGGEALKLGPKDTGQFVRSLWQADDSALAAIRKKIANREPKLTQALDELQNLKSEYQSAREMVNSKIGEARSLADRELPAGTSRISYFKKGIREDIAIPHELADVYKGLSKNQADLVSKFVAQTSRIMKATATSLNLPFLLFKNPVRDIKSFALNSPNAPLRSLAIQWVKGLSSAIRKDDYFRSWVSSGGAGVGTYREGVEVAKNLIRKQTSTKGEKVGHLVKNPADLVEAIFTPLRRVGEALESAPRLAEYRAALNKGMDTREAALAARNVTVDFAKSGRVGQIANMWVPFLNARLQGTERLASAFKNNPARALTVYTSISALPIIATYANNFDKHKDVFAQIPQALKDQNFIFIYGDGKDEDGNYTQVVKIPKGELDQVFGNPLENFVSSLYHNHPKSASQVLAETLSSISPQSFVENGQLNLSRSLAGLPPAFRVPLEYASNHNFYYDQPVVNESLASLPNERQVKTDASGKKITTSAIARVVAKATGQSPAKVDNAIQGFTGNIASSNPLTELKKQASGAPAREATNRFYTILEKTGKEYAAANQDINKAIKEGDVVKAHQIADEYNARYRKSFAGWVKTFPQAIKDPVLVDAYNNQRIRLNRSSIKQREYNIIKKQNSNALRGVST